MTAADPSPPSESLPVVEYDEAAEREAVARHNGPVVVLTSGGLGSWESGRRAQVKFGPQRVIGLFTDVKQEDADCYRFLAESTAAIGLPLEVTAEGRTPWEVAFDERFIPNNQTPICSRVLKHEPGAAWLAANAPDALVVVGIGWWEQHRRAAIAAGHAPRPVWFPMCEPPYVDNGDITRATRALGVEPPRMYAAGYEHANCAGACFRAGHAAWLRLLDDSPDLYFWHELMEQHWRRTVGKDQAVVKYRSGPLDGQPMTLQTLRRLKGRGDTAQLDLDDWGGCGCVPGDPSGVLLTIGRAPSQGYEATAYDAVTDQNAPVGAP